MNVHIDGDNDIFNFIKYYITDALTDDDIHELNYIYKIPGYRYHIDIGEFEGELFLGLILHSTINIQFKWYPPIDVYLELANKFGFVEKIDIGGYEGCVIFKRPDGFTFIQEDSFIEELLNLIANNDYVGNRYGLK